MNDLVLLGIAFLGSSALGTIVAKYFRPNATPIELLREVREDRKEDKQEIDDLKDDMRILTDYVHSLREHISQSKPPPPPPWPSELRP